MSTDVPHSVEIDAVVAAHEFRSSSITRGGIINNIAGCSCRPGLRFDWSERHAQHRAHLLAEVFAAGQASVFQPEDGTP